jgi:hypothetical protein
MTSFNLSEWALRHKSIVVYLMLAAAIAGLWAYGKLGREEDPPFTIKTMTVKTVWPARPRPTPCRSPTGSRKARGSLRFRP